jgi:hypothetical protein
MVRAERLALLAKARFTDLVLRPLSGRLGDYMLSTAVIIQDAGQFWEVTVLRAQ